MQATKVRTGRFPHPSTNTRGRVRSRAPHAARLSTLLRCVLTVALALALGSAVSVTHWAPRPVTAATAPSFLNGPAYLKPGASLVAPGGGYHLIMQADGNLVLYRSGNIPVWWVEGRPGAFLVVQAEGNVVLYDANSTPIWYTTTSSPGPRLAVQDDGNVVVYAGGVARWDRFGATGHHAIRVGEVTNLDPGVAVPSEDGRSLLVMQTDGNLVLYTDGRPVWATDTAAPANAGARLVLQADGNLVLYSATRRPLWFTNTFGGPGTRVRVQNDANVVLYAPGALWDRRGYTGHRAVLSVRDPLAGVAGYLATRSARVSVAVMDHSTGRLFVYRPGDTYRSASIGKVNVMQAVFHRGATAYQRSRMVPMIRESDNASATELFNAIGGTPALQAYDNLIGLTGTTVAGWGLARTTAADQVTLVNKLAFGGPFPDVDRRYGLDLMHTVTPSQFWGVSTGTDGSYVALKNGWLPYQGSWHVNSIGYVRGAYQHYTVAVLTEGAPSMESAIVTIEGVSARVYTNLAP